MAYVIGFVKQQLNENRSSTLREMYYISEGWKRAKFGAQDESNFLVEDLRSSPMCRAKASISARRKRCEHLWPDADPGADPAGLKPDPLPGRRGICRVFYPEQC